MKPSQPQNPTDSSVGVCQEELKKVCDAVVALGYDCEFCENGNVVFQKKEPKK